MRKNGKKIQNALAEILEKHMLQIFMSGIGLLITIFNLYTASKLAPIVQDIRLLNQKVDAIERDGSAYKPLIERFYKLEEKVDSINKSLESLGSKSDQIINQHY